MKVKLKGKGFKIFALALSCALFITSLAVSTFSKFVTMVNAPFEGKDHLDYTVNAVFIVKNQEELFAAINQGYTYVQLDKEIENPLIITQKTENLDADLILDLNGIEIQRNGYEPILNVKTGVRLTVVDTSTEQTGGLYNPVGSVFNITGGTITIMSGAFESGPRYSEYYSYNDVILNDRDGSLTRRTQVEDEPKEVMYRVKNKETGKFEEAVSKIAPIIKSYPEKKGDIEYKHGNLYFDNELTMAGSDISFKPDTYCYYRTSEDIGAEASEIAQADWYYSYYVVPNGFTYRSATVLPEEEDNYIKVTIYGYEKVIESASLKEDPLDYVAAVRMQAGVLDVQNGGFFSYFGVDRTACVNAQGGTIKINNGRFSSRVPNATADPAVLEDSVNVKEEDDIAFNDDYFNNYNWSTQSASAEYKGNLAKKGEAVCILNAGDADVNIISGKFYASNNSMISMQGGELTVDGGNFTKRLTNGIVTDDITELSAVYMQNGILSVSNATFNVIADSVHPANGIYMLAGELTVTDTNYEISGDSTTGIRMLDGQLDVTGGSCSILGDNTYGIYSTVSGQDQFHVQNTSFALTEGDNQTGIYTKNGRVNVYADSSSTISTSGLNGKGIHVDTGGSVISTNYNYELSGAQSHGIYATAGTVEVSGGHLTLTGDLSYGIYSTAGSVSMQGGEVVLTSNVSSYGVYASCSTGSVDIELKDATVDVGYSITANKQDESVNRASVGVFLATNDLNNKITLTNTNVRCYEVGILVDGGSLDVYGSADGVNDISTRKASSIIVKGGGITFDESCNYNITSSTTRNNNKDNVFQITLPTINENLNEEYLNYDGIYVSGGDFISNGNVNISHAGLYNDIGQWIYYDDMVIRSYAVRVEGGEVLLTKAHITNSVGGGVMCNGGNVTLGTENSQRSDITVETTGALTQSGDWVPVASGADESWKRLKTYTGGHAVEINGGNLTAYEGTYTAAHGDGIILNAPQRMAGEEKTKVDIHNGSFTGNMTNDKTGDRSGPAGCYGVKVFGPAIINIYNGTFNGRAGGACVGGVYGYDYNSSTRQFTVHLDENDPAEVYIYRAHFGTTSVPNDGFMIYDNSKIIFGAGGPDIASKDAISIRANLAAFSVNWVSFDQPPSPKNSTILVYYGTYTSSFHGWNKSDRASDTIVYNQNYGLTVRNVSSTGNNGYPDSITTINKDHIVYYPET